MRAVLREKHDGDLANALDIRVWLRLLTCTTTIEKRIQRRFVEMGSTLPRFDVLAALDRAGFAGLRMSELSRQLLVSNGNVTGLVRLLQDEGLVMPVPDESDGRAILVMLTPKGSAEFCRLAAAHEGWIKDMFADFGPDGCHDLYNLLGALKASIAHAEDD